MAAAAKREFFSVDAHQRSPIFYSPSLSLLLSLSLSLSLAHKTSQIRKLPALHQPWLHVAWGAAGAAGAGALVAWTEKAGAEVDAEVSVRAAANRASGRG
jgi:hypothetical protein